MSEKLRPEYKNRQSRMRRHFDYFLQQTFGSQSADQLPMADIVSGVQEATGMKVHKETILHYNERQFSRYQTAPLEWVGDDNYRMNDNYYCLLGEKVAAPKIGKPGRPRKNN